MLLFSLRLLYVANLSRCDIMLSSLLAKKTYTDLTEKGNLMKKQEVIDYFGNAKVLADKLGIWPQAVYQWPDPLPKSVQYKIEVISKGRFKVEENEGKN